MRRYPRGMFSNQSEVKLGVINTNVNATTCISILLWLSGLRIRPCHCRGLSHIYSISSIPGPRISKHQGCSQKRKKKCIYVFVNVKSSKYLMGQKRCKDVICQTQLNENENTTLTVFKI